MSEKLKKAGFVAIAGRSNAGKSTLLNTLVGTKLAITSPKPQTTRFPIQGVLHLPEGQIVFVDTPGILNKKHDKVTEKLNKSVKGALKDIDLVLYVVDSTRAIGDEEEHIMKLVKNSGIRVFLVINKIDAKKTPFIEDYRALAPDFASVIEISALKGKHIKTLTNEILAVLPEGEPFYPEYQITNIDNRLWYAELIREKLFLLLGQELPYTTSVEIDEIDIRPSGKKKIETLYITARVLTDTDQHKKMIIGKGAQKIKQIGALARREIEQINNKKVFLGLKVVTDPHWPERLN